MSTRKLNALYKYIDSLYDAVQHEIETEGARENQGYDSIYKLEDRMSPMSLRFTEETLVRRYFYLKMDNLDYSKARRVR